MKFNTFDRISYLYISVKTTLILKSHINNFTCVPSTFVIDHLNHESEVMIKQFYTYRNSYVGWSLLFLVFSTGMAVATGSHHHVMTALHAIPIPIIPSDTVKTMVLEGKIKTIKTITYHPQNVKPIRVTFTDEAYLDLTTEEALDKGISLQATPSDLPLGSGVPPSQEQVRAFVDTPPEFPGGLAALNAYLIEHIKYPQKAHEKGIQGTVFVQFVVTENGSISDIEVVKGIGGGCDEEGIRLVKAMPKWKPGMHEGKVVKVRHTIQLRFKIKYNVISF